MVTNGAQIQGFGGGRELRVKVRGSEPVLPQLVTIIIAHHYVRFQNDIARSGLSVGVDRGVKMLRFQRFPTLILIN